MFKNEKGAEKKQDGKGYTASVPIFGTVPSDKDKKKKTKGEKKMCEIEETKSTPSGNSETPGI